MEIGRPGATSILVAALLCFGFSAIVRPAVAQTSPAIVRVRVTDTAGVPLRGVDVSIHTGLIRVVSGATEADGRHTLRFAADNDEYDLVVRHIGYLRADRIFKRPTTDTLTFDVVLHPTVAVLQAVVVSAEVTAKQKAYNIDADQIAQSSRPLSDVNDIIHKLRPQMWTSLSPEICDGASFAAPWPALSSLWINGERIPVIKQTKPAEAEKSAAMMIGHPAAASLASLPAADSKWVRQQITALLHEIKPEHVAEMHYVDCFDTLMPGLDASNALYIILKTGIAYSFARGSYVVEQKGVRQTAEADPAGSSPSWRNRVIGTFAANGGMPLPDVAVVNDSANMQTLTNASGAASLQFLPAGQSRVRLTKAGFRDTSFVVTIGAADTVPITILLEVSDTSRRTPRRPP